MDMNSMFDAPVPGQSLTKPVGASPNEHPPQFTQLDDALNFTWDKLHKPKSMIKLIGMIKAQIPVEILAQNILYQGLLKNNWNVDLALLMLQTVIWQIEAIAKLKKVKYITFTEDTDHNNAMLTIGNMITTTSVKDQTLSVAKSPTDQILNAKQPDSSQFKGFF